VKAVYVKAGKGLGFRLYVKAGRETDLAQILVGSEAACEY
jgi:hypothetical protein